ncbi:MAG: helix-turn-helix domain-containing protein [Victivallales bacterium]
MNKKTKNGQINPQLNVWWAGWWKPEFVERSRYLYDHELVVFTAGTSRVVAGEQSFTCSRGDALIIPPGVRHWTRALNERVERYCFHFDWVRGLPVVIPSFVFESTKKYRPRQCKPAPKWLKIKTPFYTTGLPLQRLLLLLHPLLECDGRRLENALKQQGLFLQLLSEVLSGNQPVRASARGGKSLRMVQSLKQRIEYDYRKDLTIRSLAKEFNVTPLHMSRAFRMIVGTGPLEYVHRLRLEEAYLLLSEGSRNVSEVAGMVGFEDANYFSRLFRKKMGMVPSMVATNLGNEPSNANIH